MYESNENQTPAEMSDSVTNAISIEELQNKVTMLETQVAYNKAAVDDYRSRLMNRITQIGQVEEYLRDNWDDLGDHAQEIADLLDISVTITKTFTFDLRVTVEIEAESPAFDWSNFDGSEIEFDVSSSVSYSTTGIEDATVEDVEITSCEED